MTIVEDPQAQAPAKSKRQRKPSQAVAVHKAQPPAAAPAVNNLLDVIVRAGSDPNFDVEKFRALVAIQREEQDRLDARAEREAALEAEAAFNAAMSAVQAKMTRVQARLTNTQTKSVYADYDALDRMLRPLYTEANFGLTYGEEDSPKPDHVRVFCLVTHSPPDAKRGHTRKYHTDMPADGKGAKGGDVMTKTHATGSAFTYGQRYLLKMIFNIVVSKDDDGNAAGDTATGSTITALQLKELQALIKEVDANAANVCKACHVETLEEMTQSQFEKAKAKLEAMRAPL
jgi:hypothetical protein